VAVTAPAAVPVETKPVATAPAAPAAPPPKPAIEPPAPPPAPVKPGNESAAAKVGGVAWRWPNGGKLIGTYVVGDQTRQGVDIAGSVGDPVLASADGEVVYSGNGLLGYGELIIVKHNAIFLSAYGHNRKRLVAEGDKVRAGQQIAEMGSSSSSRNQLHFEIRKSGKPVNPLDYLPSR
jgi:lipoprotein NlpD